jgi:hypothetical protein
MRMPLSKQRNRLRRVMTILRLGCEIDESYLGNIARASKRRVGGAGKLTHWPLMMSRLTLPGEIVASFSRVSIAQDGRVSINPPKYRLTKATRKAYK